MESFREYVLARCVREPSGCWRWILSIGSHGYGQASTRKQRVTTAHRVAYEAFIGPIPPGMLVQHSCDNKQCVNPEHLSLGTDATNAEDKRRKGRAAKKLSPTDRALIPLMYSTGTWTQRELAARFGVTQRAIWMVLQQQQSKPDDLGGSYENRPQHGAPTPARCRLQEVRKRSPGPGPS